MRIWKTVVLLVASIAPAAAGGPEPALGTKGRALLEQHCSRCHGVTTDDASKHQKAPPFREVMTRYPAENIAEALAEGIVSGHPDMPEFTFKADEIDAIVLYLDGLTARPKP